MNYIKYAIGEIILVVIGILIALQVNNQNEIRKNKLLEKRYITDLIADLQKDSIALTDLVTEAKETARIKSKLKLYFNGQPVQTDSLDIFFKSQWTPFRVFTPTKTTMEEMKNSGRLDLVSDREIKRKIIGLYDQYDLLHQDELLFMASTRQLQELGRSHLNDIDAPTEDEIISLFGEREVRNNIRVNYATGRKSVTSKTLSACELMLSDLRKYLNKLKK
ncbi:DUF6090 family protein [Namhaeicola litoreus]|uniref:DUF6090 family protein n=1 Tax=Namhaeicola litoreus TaxID=1052145 RepID=A0ABW3Y0E5_9FLAO